MITVHLNGELHQIEKNCSLIDFLIKQNYKTGCYAIMLNRNFLPSAYHEKTFLCEGDMIDTITPMQGG